MGKRCWVCGKSINKIVTESLDYNLGEINRKELMRTIKRLKRRKAPGPDGIPMEFFKALNGVNLDRILEEVINVWWREEEIPLEQLKARAVLIFKNKGNSNDIDNYRPISLTSSLYKIFTAILQERLEEQIDPYLQKT